MKQCVCVCVSYGDMCLLCGFYVMGACVLLLVIWSCHYFFYVYVCCFCVMGIMFCMCVIFQYSINHLVLIWMFYLNLLWNFCIPFRSCVFDVSFISCVSNFPFWKHYAMWINSQMEARVEEELLRTIKMTKKFLLSNSPFGLTFEFRIQLV